MKCIVKKLMRLDGQAHLVPGYAVDEEVFEKLRVGSMYKVDIRKARNPDFHRKAFALIKLIFESQEKYRTIEDLLIELKLRVGWYHEHIRSNGELIYVPKSISFADMDDLHFAQFYDAVIDIAIQDYGLKDAVEFI